MKCSRLFPICLTAVISICFIARAESRTNARTAGEATVRHGRSVGRHQIVFFPGVRNETSGIAAEHAWTAAQYPNYEWKKCELFEDRFGRTYQRVLLQGPRGREIIVYFDVTNWYPS